MDSDGVKCGFEIYHVEINGHSVKFVFSTIFRTIKKASPVPRPGLKSNWLAPIASSVIYFILMINTILRTWPGKKSSGIM